MKLKDALKFLILRTIGNFLVLFTIFGFGATFGPAVYYEANYQMEQRQGITYKVINAATSSELASAIKKYENNPQASANDNKEPKIDKTQSLFVVPDNPNEKIMIPKSTKFSVIVPKIGINEAVYENVDPTNDKEYLEVLKKGVAHAKGSAYPGMNGTTYIFAHSTDNFWNVGRYNAVFYLLNKLEPGDDIVTFFYDQRYNYIVKEKKVVDGDAVEYLQANIGKGERIILQTCWPPGTTWKRLIVIAEPKIQD